MGGYGCWCVDRHVNQVCGQVWRGVEGPRGMLGRRSIHTLDSLSSPSLPFPFLPAPSPLLPFTFPLLSHSYVISSPLSASLLSIPTPPFYYYFLNRNYCILIFSLSYHVFIFFFPFLPSFSLQHFSFYFYFLHPSPLLFPPNLPCLLSLIFFILFLPFAGFFFFSFPSPSPLPCTLSTCPFSSFLQVSYLRSSQSPSFPSFPFSLSLLIIFFFIFVPFPSHLLSLHFQLSPLILFFVFPPFFFLLSFPISLSFTYSLVFLDFCLTYTCRFLQYLQSSSSIYIIQTFSTTNTRSLLHTCTPASPFHLAPKLHNFVAVTVLRDSKALFFYFLWRCGRSEWSFLSTITDQRAKDYLSLNENDGLPAAWKRITSNCIAYTCVLMRVILAKVLNSISYRSSGFSVRKLYFSPTRRWFPKSSGFLTGGERGIEGSVKILSQVKREEKLNEPVKTFPACTECNSNKYNLLTISDTQPPLQRTALLSRKSVKWTN